MKRRFTAISSGDNAGFTMTELLVVLGVITVLSLLLLPAFAGTKNDGRVLRCMNNQKQLSAAWLVYTSDNADLFPPSPSWAAGVLDWTAATDNTNRAILESSASSLIALYVKAADLFKCPADTYQSSANLGPRVRSVSLNGVLGSNPSVQGSNPGGRLYYGSGGAGKALKMTQLVNPGPANVFSFLDEHPDSINDSAFMFDPGYPSSAQMWRSLPGSFHSGLGALSFADGHFELHQWTNPRTPSAVIFTAWNLYGSIQIMRDNEDYSWLNDRMPYR